MSVKQRETVTKIDHYKVRGEAGSNIVTGFKDGCPVLENPPIALASPSPPSLPTFEIEDKIKEARSLLLDRDETAHYRLNLIDAIGQEVKRGRFFHEILEEYNSGRFLKNTFETLGPVPRRTYFRWKSAFNLAGVEGLTPRTGRKKTSKITSDEIKTTLKYLLRPNRLKIAEGIYQAKEELRGKGIESQSSPDIIRRFVNRVIKERADMWIYYREGSKAADDKVFPYLERDWSALEVGDVIVGDGHRLNFQVIDPYSGKPCRPIVVLFWDWRSSYVLGWELLPQESIQCIYSALRNSIICLGKKPKCVYLDNGKAFKAKVFTSDINLTDTEIIGMFKRLEIEAHFALPYNARSKPVERIFRNIGDQLERLTPGYMGSCIGDKPAWMLRNEKFARSMHDPRIPTIEEANSLFLWWRNRYVGTPTRARDGLRPKDIFDQGKGAGVKLSELDYLMMSGEIRQVHRNGITWLGRHWYDSALCGLNDKVLIKYSYSDLSQIYVYYKDELLCIAKPVQKVHPMASLSKDPKDMEELNRQRGTIRIIRRDVKKVCREGSPNLFQRLPLKEIAYEIPKIDIDIEKIEAEKPSKRVSPFLDDFKNSDLPIALAEETNIDAQKDDIWALSCPDDKEMREMYEWYCQQDPEKIGKIIDLGWIDWYEDGYKGKHFDKEWEQNDLKYQISKRQVKSKNEGNGGDFQEGRTDYRLGRDPVIEAHWREIRDGIVIDPISGLSRPGELSEFPNGREKYEFYRGIEKRFPGNLTDGDWEWIEEYQSTREWEFHFFEMEVPRLYKMIKDSPNKD